MIQVKATLIVYVTKIEVLSADDEKNSFSSVRHAKQYNNILLIRLRPQNINSGGC